MTYARPGWDIQEIPSHTLSLGPHEYLKELPGVRFSDLYYPGKERASLEEKAKALKLPLSSICCTYIFQSQAGGRLYGAVVPADSQVDVARLEALLIDELSHDAAVAARSYEHEGLPVPHRIALERDKRIRLRLEKAKTLPYAMRPGSCGPFPCEHDLEMDEDGRTPRGGLRKILYDIPDERVAMEYVVPGRRDISFRAPFRDVAKLVQKHFPGVIGKGSFRIAPTAAPVAEHASEAAYALSFVPA